MDTKQTQRYENYPPIQEGSAQQSDPYQSRVVARQRSAYSPSPEPAQTSRRVLIGALISLPVVGGIIWAAGARDVDPAEGASDPELLDLWGERLTFPEAWEVEGLSRDEVSLVRGANRIGLVLYQTDTLDPVEELPLALDGYVSDFTGGSGKVQDPTSDDDIESVVMRVSGKIGKKPATREARLLLDQSASRALLICVDLLTSASTSVTGSAKAFVSDVVDSWSGWGR